MKNLNVNFAEIRQGPPFAPQPQYQPLNIQHTYKSQLQKYAQQSSIELPWYQTVIESGVAHAPNFRCTVIVGGVRYTSQNTFSQRKLAEQDAARIALDSIIDKQREQTMMMSSAVVEDFSFCICILNEYAMKLGEATPTYISAEKPRMLPFVCTVIFNGESYIGDSARNKKIAKQSAAREAVISILGDSKLGPQLYEIIQSKCKNFDAAKLKALEYIHANVVQSPPPMENNNVALIENVVDEDTSDEIEGAKGLLYLYKRELELMKIKENANK